MTGRRILVLGGAGRVGRRVAEILASRAIGDVVCGDHAEPADGVPTSFLRVDVADDAQLASAVDAHDVVVNTVGPFDRWGARVLDAAIERGTDYLDICDDPWPTIDLLRRGPLAARRGVRAVVGLGASPGLPNLLMVVAARRLHRTASLTSYWGDPGEGLDASAAAERASRAAAAFRGARAAMKHLVVQTSGTVPAWRDGRLADVVPWADPHRLTLSSGETGLFRVMGHPEPITVPRMIAVQTAQCIGTVGAGLDRLVLDASTRVATEGVSVEQALADMAARLESDPSLVATPALGPPLPALIGAVATGTRGGERRSVVAMPGVPTDGSMSFETARVAALGVELLVGVAPGVHPPEQAFDADEFLGAFSAREGDGAPPYRLDDQPGDAIAVEGRR